jgi:hypothetical protein
VHGPPSSSTSSPPTRILGAWPADRSRSEARACSTRASSGSSGAAAGGGGGTGVRTGRGGPAVTTGVVTGAGAGRHDIR